MVRRGLFESALIEGLWKRVDQKKVGRKEVHCSKVGWKGVSERGFCLKNGCLGEGCLLFCNGKADAFIRNFLLTSVPLLRGQNCKAQQFHEVCKVEGEGLDYERDKVLWRVTCPNETSKTNGRVCLTSVSHSLFSSISYGVNGIPKTFCPFL